MAVLYPNNPELTQLIPNNPEEMQAIAAQRTSRTHKHIREKLSTTNYIEKLKAIEEGRREQPVIIPVIDYLHSFAGKHVGYQQWISEYGYPVVSSWNMPDSIDEITHAYEHKYVPGLVQSNSVRIIQSFYGINDLFR